MGIIGIEVLKDVVLMILIDDNFVIIVKFVINGRNIYVNIKNLIKFLFLGNMFGILVVFYLLLFVLLVLFVVVYLLFINFLIDSLFVIVIGMEKFKKDVLRDKFRDVNEFILL